MVPKGCINCNYGTNINGDGGSVVSVVCSAIPIQVTKRPGDMCSMFAMQDNPISIPDEEPAIEETQPISDK